MKMIETWRAFYRRDRFLGTLYVLMTLFCLLLFLQVFLRYFDHDTIEHVHSAWYLSRGYRPYLDFFQVHHPLLWVFSAPVISLLGESPAAVTMLRFIMALFTLGSAWAVYRIARLVTRSSEVSRLAPLFLLSSVMFLEKGIEVRPDVPQVFFALWSFYYFLRFTGTVKERHPAASWKTSCASGCLAGISFLFLQKALFLLVAYALFLFYKLVKKEFPGRSVALFALSFSLPQAGLVFYLWHTGAFPEYILTNWLVPAKVIAHFSAHHTLLGMFAESTLVWTFIAAALFTLLPRKKTGLALRLVMWVGLVIFIGASFMRLPFKQNYLLAVALFCIPAAYFFKVSCFRYRWNARTRARALIGVTAIPLVILSVMTFLTGAQQKAKIRYVLECTGPGDLVYDGDARFNVFRKDLHYFWYGLRKNKEFTTYKRLTGRPREFDLPRLIREKKPAFISGTRLDVEKSGLYRDYEKTPFKGLYSRRKNGGDES